MAMVRRPTDVMPGTPAGDARAALVTGLSVRASERVIEAQIESGAHLMSDEWKAFMAIGESFAKHETVKHSSGEYVRDAVHVNSVEGFNSRVRRTIAGVFHHISPQHADLYFHEIGFRWSQRVVTGNAIRKTRHGREIMRTLWSRVPPALQLPNVFRAATGRQMRRSPDGGILIKSSVVDKRRVRFRTALVPTPYWTTLVVTLMAALVLTGQDELVICAGSGNRTRHEPQG